MIDRHRHVNYIFFFWFKKSYASSKGPFRNYYKSNIEFLLYSWEGEGGATFFQKN